LGTRVLSRFNTVILTTYPAPVCGFNGAVRGEVTGIAQVKAGASKTRLDIALETILISGRIHGSGGLQYAGWLMRQVAHDAQP